jgi:hypothetical protein
MPPWNSRSANGARTDALYHHTEARIDCIGELVTDRNTNQLKQEFNSEAKKPEMFAVSRISNSTPTGPLVQKYLKLSEYCRVLVECSFAPRPFSF